MWIRVEADRLQSAEVRRLAKRLRCEPYTAMGLLDALEGAVARYCRKGSIRDIEASLLELWVEWRGKRGVFARAVRDLLVDDDGRLRGWDAKQGPLENMRARNRRSQASARTRSLTVSAVRGLLPPVLGQGRADTSADVSGQRNETKRNERTEEEGGDGAASTSTSDRPRRDEEPRGGQHREAEPTSGVPPASGELRLPRGSEGQPPRGVAETPWTDRLLQEHPEGAPFVGMDRAQYGLAAVEKAAFELAASGERFTPKRFRRFVEVVVKRREERGDDAPSAVPQPTASQRERPKTFREIDEAREADEARQRREWQVGANAKQFVGYRRDKPDGEAWWSRMLQEATANGLDPLLYAYERRDQPAESPREAVPA